ncbi:MAG: hypothetical protein KC464_09675, partial [Myxococcales bacterium]|nr:hypothetical protein [Myxococcales bacterium]
IAPVALGFLAACPGPAAPPVVTTTVGASAPPATDELPAEPVEREDVEPGLAAGDDVVTDDDDDDVWFDGHDCWQGAGDRRRQVACTDDVFLEVGDDTAVTLAADDGCYTVARETVRVRCPPGGPTVVPPATLTVKQGKRTFEVDLATYACRVAEDFECPKDAFCDPAPGDHRPIVACPAALRPRLAPGVAPTDRHGKDCYLGTLAVACPTQAVTGPRVTSAEDDQGRRVVVGADGRCAVTEERCDDAGTCGIFEAPVACPAVLLPVLVNGKAPKVKDDGTCWWKKTQVRCPS